MKSMFTEERSDSENLVALNFDNICHSKQKQEKFKIGTTEVHVLTFFQNFC